MSHPLHDIRIGTLIGGAGAADMIRKLLPYGFESFSLTFGQQLGDTQLPRLAEEVRSALAGSNAVISSISFFGNPLETSELDLLTVAGFESAIDHAHEFGTDIVSGFAGRVRGKKIPESIPRFTEVWGRLADRAAAKNVRLAFENCSGGGDWNNGDWNIAHGPDAWELMFNALPAAHVGLEWEPCHQMIRLCDPFPQLDDWHRRIFHLHGKDATIDRARIARYGIGASREWAWHRTPGFGESDWTAIITRLRQHGFKGSIDIEGGHDPVYVGELEYTGQVHGLNHLLACRGGKVPVQF